MKPPTTPAEFDRAYRAPVTFWGDVRVPDEVKALVRDGAPRSALELGCGVGRFSRYAAQQGLRVTGVDFSPVAIDKARENAAQDPLPPSFVISDVTRLDGISGPFDVAFDVGCFHCLAPDGQRRYAAELARVLKPGATHLMWALDGSPSDLDFSPALVQDVFAPAFTLADARKSRRRLVRSHWYWLVRN